VVVVVVEGDVVVGEGWVEGSSEEVQAGRTAQKDRRRAESC